MARRHGRTAPYEIMRQVGGAPPLPNAKRTLRAAAETPPPAPDGDSSWGGVHGLRWVLRVPRGLTLGAISDRLSSWGSAVRSPVALRLPAMAVAGIGLAGVLALAGVFWMGAQMGQRAALTGEAVAPVGEAGLAAADKGGLIAPSQLAVRAQDTLDTPGGAIDLPTADPRIPGHNYLCFVSLRWEDIDEARRMQRFFQQAGVATILTGDRILDPVSGEQPDWIQVIDVSRGFTAAEMHNGEHESFYATRRALGRAWKAHNRGIGSDLNTMIFYQAKPPSD